MICPKCNKENFEGSIFCSGCGNRLENIQHPVANRVDLTSMPTTNNVVQQQPVTSVQQVVNVQPVVQPTVNPQQTQSSGLDNKQKGIILGLLGLFVVLLIVAVVFKVGNKNSSIIAKNSSKEATRTIMIYLDGTNLESNGGIASAELAAINPEKVDLNTTNVLVYTGGTKKWYNYIKNTENAIYKLTSNGFEKIETYEKLNMSDPATLTSFLKYSYDNFNAGHMDLVLFDHGGATLGAISDDFYNNDIITLEEFKKALKDSPFNENNKLELIAFRTCLNGTIENANTFADSAEYLVASEEVTYGRGDSNVLGYFINDLSSSASGLEVGEKFIDAYIKNMEKICYFPDQTLITYAVMDLSNVRRLTSEFEKIMSSIDVKQNYSTLSKIRSGMLQFAGDETSFDTVDMYDLVQKTKLLSSVDTTEFDKAFKDTVVYYYTNNKEETNGISVYMPYKGKKTTRSALIKLYDSLDFMSDYKKFITTFNDALNGTGIEYQKPFSFTNSTQVLVDNGEELTLELSDDQKDNYANAKYVLFKRDKDKPAYYELVLTSDDVDTSEPGKLKTKIGNSLIKLYDEENNSMYLPIDRVKQGESDIKDVYSGIFYNKNAGDFGQMDTAKASMYNKDGRPVFGDVIISGDRDQRYDGIVRNVNDYTSIEVLRHKYKILGSDGNVLPVDEWEVPATRTGLSIGNFKTDDVNSEIDLRYEGIDDGDWYVLFIVFDMNQVAHYDKLIKVGE